MKRYIFVALALFLFDKPAIANETQYWSSVQVTSKVNDELNLLAEWVNRYSVDKSEFATRFVRLGVAYKFAEKWSYAFIVESRTSDSSANAENRFIHQVNRKWEYEDFGLGFRGRFEQREFADSQSISNRLRALLRLDAKAYSFLGLTPWISSEYFYVLNTVTNRTMGSYETRNNIGFVTSFFTGQAELSYLSRQTVRAAKDNVTKKATDYDIANLVFKFNF